MYLHAIPEQRFIKRYAFLLFNLYNRWLNVKVRGEKTRCDGGETNVVRIYIYWADSWLCGRNVFCNT